MREYDRLILKYKASDGREDFSGIFLGKIQRHPLFTQGILRITSESINYASDPYVEIYDFSRKLESSQVEEICKIAVLAFPDSFEFTSRKFDYI